MFHCSFTQRDVDEGRVWYVHSGNLIGGDGISDQLLFSVTDSSHPPNILADQAFIIHVDSSTPGSNVFPAPGTQLTTTVSIKNQLPLENNYLVAMLLNIDIYCKNRNSILEIKEPGSQKLSMYEKMYHVWKVESIAT